MRAIFILAVGLLTLYSTPAAAQPQRACQFSILQAAPVPMARGGEDFLSRLRFVRQPDSPIAVTAIDFGTSTLTVGEGNYAVSRGDGYRLEVLNVSDQPVSNIQVMVYTRWLGLGGTGSGGKSTEPLPPGQRTILTVRGGRGRGTNPRTERLTVDVVVESVHINGCIYRPSQSLPQQF